MTGGRARPRIPLPAPHLTGNEYASLAEAIQSNWIASVGPDVDAFEEEFASHLGVGAALATTSGTAAIHLALRVLGVQSGDEVLVSTLTFCASVNPILYLGATPVFVDSEDRSWNLDPSLLAEELDRRGQRGTLPAAVVVVHLYGQMADMTPILAACARWSVPVVEDAAESLGASYGAAGGLMRPAGTLGTLGIFSFDGSKVITTSMGGLLVSNRPELVGQARKLARQAREPVAHYEHEEIGYNYRMSNLLAAFGREQLRVLDSRVAARRRIFDIYRRELVALDGISLQHEAPWGVHSRWLTCLEVDPEVAGIDRESMRQELLENGIESRAVWKPMHLQPVYARSGFPTLGGGVAQRLFMRGLCLPSSSYLAESDVAEVAGAIREIVRRGR